jgi:hypothetical protein
MKEKYFDPFFMKKISEKKKKKKKKFKFPHLKRVIYNPGYRAGIRFDPYRVDRTFLAEEEQLTLPGTNSVRDTYAVHHGDIKMSLGNYIKFMNIAYENDYQLMNNAGIDFENDYIVYNIKRMTIDEYNDLDTVIPDNITDEDFVVYGNTKMTLDEFINKLKNPPYRHHRGQPPPPIRSQVRQASPPRSPVRQASPPRSPVRQASPPRSPVRQASPPRSPVRQASPPRRSPPRQRSPGVPVPSGSFVEIQVDEDDACPICLEGFDLQNLKIVKCKYNNLHKIHKDCLAIFRAHNPEAPCFQCRPVKK